MDAFEFMEVEHQLEVVDRDSTTFRSEHKYILKPKSPSRFFVREYFWTGSGSEKEHMPELVSEIDNWGFPYQKIHGPLISEGNVRIVVVDLGRTIGVGETEHVHFRHKMKDLAGTFQPMFLVRPKKKIYNSLRFRIILPDWTGLEMIYRRLTHDTEKVLETTKIIPSKTNGGKAIFEKEIIKPHKQNMGHKVEWSHRET